MASLREEGTQAPIWGGTVVEIPAEGTVEMELPLRRRDL
jgi:hypothetical protein